MSVSETSSAGNPASSKAVMEAGELDRLIAALERRGFRVIAPALRDGAIAYEEVAGLDDLPAGWTDRQAPGEYRVEKRDDGALFGYAVGPHSWKRYLHRAYLTLWRARRDHDGGLKVEDGDDEDARYAFIGVRACDLAAIGIQDRVLMGGEHVDSHYARRRDKAFIVAVNCAEPAGTCFCVSMQTGPAVTSGYDLALTELIDGDGHRFLVEFGSAAGRDAMSEVAHRPADDGDIDAARAVVDRAAERMGREMETDGLPDLLARNLEHPRWDDVAERCLTCTNCTMVCPTCFCTSVEDHTDLEGGVAERTRRWDSCFTLDFSYLHGGSVRRETRSRYRQWMTHKLGTWHDQFGSSGCVGCGRCITWCPVGIDITEEAAAIRADDRGKQGEDE